MKPTLLTLITLFLLFNPLINNAQTTKKIKINGLVLFAQKPIDVANVTLHRSQDSALVKMAITNKQGEFEFLDIETATYFIQIQAIGFTKYSSAIIPIKENKTILVLPPINLFAATKELGNVTVTSKKVFIEQKLDRTIVNVEALATNAGLTAFEVLEKAPGVVVDKDGNISLKGKQGILILVDGRPTYLSGQDLTNMLANMPSSNLEQLEIMTNPPAKYDASGNAGVINIRTKKTKTVGFNGSASVNYSQGVYPKTNQSLNLNYRVNKINFFANGGYSYRENFQEINIDRNFVDMQTSKLLSSVKQLADVDKLFKNYSYKFGVDYFLDKKTTMGIVLNGFDTKGNEYINNSAVIRNDVGAIVTKNRANNENIFNNMNFSANINFRKIVDTIGSEITADIDYITYQSNNKQNLNNYFFDAYDNKKNPDEFMRGTLPADIHIYSAKVDYATTLKKQIKLEAGIKTSYVTTDNNALYEIIQNGNWQTDLGKSNHFKYEENINAAYINLNKKLNKKWVVQTGLRVENTNANGKQLNTGQTFNKNYTQLFPTLYIGYSANDKNQFAVSYGKRIERPDYDDLNPFYFFLDKYTYQVGNPYLQPQFTHSLELSYSFAGFFTATINYAKTNNIIQDLFDQIDSTNTTFIRKENIATQKNMGIALSANIPVTKWWKTNLYTNAFNNQYKGLINGKEEEIEGATITANFSNQFSFKKGWAAELSANYQSKAVGGTMVANPMGAVHIALSKQILKDKGNIKLSVRDLFLTQNFTGYSKYQNIDIVINQRRDSRVINLGFTYRFSKGKPMQQQKRNGGASSEQNRVKTNQ